MVTPADPKHRLSPSGPKLAPAAPPPDDDLSFFHIENVSFGTFIFNNPAPEDPLTNESQSTKELIISVGPLPPAADLESEWSVLQNPIPEVEGRLLWMNDYSISHVRIQQFRFVPGLDINNPWIPPEGAMVADVVLGLSLLKTVPVDGQLAAVVPVDLMFFKRGTLLNLLLVVF
jgi:hypothetical protein